MLAARALAVCARIPALWAFLETNFVTLHVQGRLFGYAGDTSRFRYLMIAFPFGIARFGNVWPAPLRG